MFDRRLVAGAVVGASLFAGCASNPIPGVMGVAAGPPSSPAPEASSPVARAGLRVYVDPESGRLLAQPPSRDSGLLLLSPELEEAARIDDEGLFEVLHEDGSVSVDLQGRFRPLLVVRRAADGSMVFFHPSPSAPAAVPEVENPEVAP